MLTNGVISAIIILVVEVNISDKNKKQKTKNADMAESADAHV